MEYLGSPRVSLYVPHKCRRKGVSEIFCVGGQEESGAYCIGRCVLIGLSVLAGWPRGGMVRIDPRERCSRRAIARGLGLGRLGECAEAVYTIKL